jgi:hypothetical protein
MRGVQEALLRVTPFLRARLTDVVSMKRLPDLHFHRDRVAEASLRAEQLLTRERLAAPATPTTTAAPASGSSDQSSSSDSRSGDGDAVEAAPPGP